MSHGGWQWRGTSSVEKMPHLSKFLPFPEKQIKWLNYKQSFLFLQNLTCSFGGKSCHIFDIFWIPMIHLPLEYIIYFKLKKDKKKMLRYSTILVIEVKIHKKHCGWVLQLTCFLFETLDTFWLLMSAWLRLTTPIIPNLTGMTRPHKTSIASVPWSIKSSFVTTAKVRRP